MGRVKLKPCPFCGGNARLVWNEKHNVFSYRVVCNECGASTKAILHKELAAERWNGRKEG